MTSSGLVAAVGKGTASIVATSGGVSGMTGINVVADASTLRTVEVTPAAATVSRGDTIRLSARLVDVAGNGVPAGAVTWQSIQPDVATVSATGLVSALRGGTAVVVATVDGYGGSAPVTVLQPPDPRIVITVFTPTANAEATDSVLVTCAVSSPKAIVQVNGLVDSRPLQFRAVLLGTRGLSGWATTIGLKEFGEGPHRILIRAHDVTGSFGVDSVWFINKPRNDGGGGSGPTGFRQLRPAPRPAVPPPDSARASAENGRGAGRRPCDAPRHRQRDHEPCRDARKPHAEPAGVTHPVPRRIAERDDASPRRERARWR